MEGGQPQTKIRYYSVLLKQAYHESNVIQYAKAFITFASADPFPEPIQPAVRV